MILAVSQAGGAGEASDASAAQPLRVVFVCTANICRSAFAEVLARHLAGAGAPVMFASAGTYGLPAQPMNPDIAEFLPEGASPEGFASRPITAAIAAEADLMLTAEAVHRTFVLQEYPTTFRKVLTLGQFAEATERTEARGRALVDEIFRMRPPTRPRHDIADPYRRGRAANEQAAAQITRLLEIVVPVLVDTMSDPSTGRR